MFRLIGLVFVVLLRFSKSSTCHKTKCLFLNDEPYIFRPILIYLNPIELKYYLFQIYS